VSWPRGEFATPCLAVSLLGIALSRLPGINVVIVFIFIVGALVGDAANLRVGGAKTVAVHVIAATIVIAVSLVHQISSV
jgi:cytochrome b561